MKKNVFLRVLSAVCALVLITLSFAGCGLGRLQFDKKTPDNLKHEITDSGTVKITGYTDTTAETEVIVPDEIDGMPVTEIADFSLFNSESVQKITIGKNVQTIGPWALTNDQGLREFAVAEGNGYFKTVDGILFSKDMKTLVSYPSARNIEFDKYGQAQNTTDYDIPDGVVTIRSKAFYKCYYVSHISIPDSVTTIEEKAFHRCSDLETLVLPASLASIGKDAFAYCVKLESVTVPAGVTSIGDYAFFNCKNVKQVDMLCSQDNVVLGQKWYPTDNGRQVKDCVINWQ